MKNEINTGSINNSSNIKNIINPKTNFREGFHFILPDINLSDVLTNDEIENVLRDREIYEILIKNNEFESPNLTEYLNKLDKDFYKIGNYEFLEKKRKDEEIGESTITTNDLIELNENLECIKFQENLSDVKSLNFQYNSYIFKDKQFYQNLITEIRGIPFNKMTLIILFLDYAINFLIKSKKTPIAKGLEWTLKEIRENFSYQIDKSTVEYFEKIKDSNQQTKTVYEWVKEYSSFNDNQKNIYDLAKSKNINSLKNNKKKLNINYSTNPHDYKKLKRLTTYNTPHVTLTGKGFGTVGSGTIPYSNTIIGATKNEVNMNNNSLSNKTNSVNPHQRNSYVDKTRSDIIVVKKTNNLFSKEKNEDLILKEKLNKYNNYKIYNNNSSDISDKGPNLTEFIASYNDKKFKRSSYSKNQSFSKSNNRKNLDSFNKNNKINISNTSKTKSDFGVFSKSPEKINSSLEDYCKSKFVTGKISSTIKTKIDIKNNDYKFKNIIQNKNSSNFEISTLTNTNNNSLLLNSRSISLTKKIRNEDSYLSFSKSPYNILKNSTNNQSDQLNPTTQNNLKVNTPVKPNSKLNLNLKSNKKGYSNKLNDAKKIPISINKFIPHNSLNKSINDVNINRNTIFNSSLKDKKSFNEHFLSKYTKNQNNSYKYNGILKYHNTSNANNNFFIKKKNEIQFARRKSRSYNEKEFRATGMGINIKNENSKIEVEEENEMDKSENDVLDDLIIKDESDNNKNLLNLLNQESKKIEIQLDMKANEDIPEEKIIRKDSDYRNDKRYINNNKSCLENIKNEFDKGKSLDNSINSVKTIQSRRSILSNKSQISLKDENELLDFYNNIKSNNKRDKKLLNKAKSICENGNKRAGEALDIHFIDNQIIVFEKINEDEKDMLIYSSRMNKKQNPSKLNLNQGLNEKDEDIKKIKGVKSEKKICYNFNKYYILEKIYKITEKRKLSAFHKNELNNELDDNHNYITFNNNCKNSTEKHIFIDSFKYNNNSNFINEENSEIVQILNTDLNAILARIPNKKYTRILKSFDDNLSQIESPEFNIFNLKTFVGAENILPVLASYIFSISDYFSFLNKKHFENFIYEVSRGYIKENYYHNDLHGADVTQSSYMYLTKGNLKETLILTDIDCAGFLLASIIHDFKHPGLTNGFLINSKDIIALTYNDNSVLENFHVAEAFKIITFQKNCNIFSDLSKEDYKIIRKRIIELVLATDMTMHAKELSFIKSKLESLILLQNPNHNQLNSTLNIHEKDSRSLDPSNSLSIYKDKDKASIIKILLENSNSSNLFTMQQEFLNIMIHLADISNPTKPKEIYMKWTDLVMNEFWLQGDKEKSLSLPISFLCDRVGASIPKAQLGFMDGIVMPLLICIVDIFPGLIFLKENIEKNKIAYKELLEKEEAEKKMHI